ncbi:glycosyltransferase family 2 protein [Ferruginibacter profundus]
MKQVPEITVLMPAYNAAKYIVAAVTSVLNQSFQNFELLVINDGSSDDTERIVKNFADERIKLINQPHQGIAAALNIGLLNAAAPLIARFDADDICYPERLQIQYDFFKTNPEYVLTGSDVDYADHNSEYLYHYANVGHTHEEINDRIGSFCPFIHSSVMYKKETALAIGGYDARAHTFEDYRLWIKFITKGKVCNTKKPLIMVRLNPESVTVDEKLRGKRFGVLKKEMLFTDSISKKQEEELLEILQRQDFMRFKNYSYNILVAKKYLWNNYQPAKARSSVRKAIHFMPFQTTGYGLFILSCLPQKFVHRFYKKYKLLTSS